MKNIKGLSNYENDDYTNFTLPPSGIQPYIEVGSYMTLARIVGLSNKWLNQYMIGFIKF